MVKKKSKIKKAKNMKTIIIKNKKENILDETNHNDNPLRELYGVGVRVGKLITQKEFKKFRKSLESKWLK